MRRQLEEMLGLGKPGQLVETEVVRGDAGELGDGALREDNLAAVAGLAEAGGPVDVETDEAVARSRRRYPCAGPCGRGRLLTGPGSREKRALGVRCGLDRVVRRLEDRERLVGTTLDLAAAVFGDRPAEGASGTPRGRGSTRGRAAHEARRPLDVGEEKGELVLGHDPEGSSSSRGRSQAATPRATYGYPHLSSTHASGVSSRIVLGGEPMLARERARRIALAEARDGVRENGSNTAAAHPAIPGRRQLRAGTRATRGATSFIVWCYREARRELTETGRSASVPETARAAAANGWVVRKPKPGDVVCFQLPIGGLRPVDETPDHIGIVVEAMPDGLVRTVEGNTIGDSGGEGVFVKTRRADECETFIRVPGGFRPGSAEETMGRGQGAPAPARPLGHKTVDVDGEFGERTEKSVEKFQGRHGLAETGIAGKETVDAIRAELEAREQPPVRRTTPKRRVRRAGDLRRRNDRRSRRPELATRDAQAGQHVPHRGRHLDRGLARAVTAPIR